MTQALHSQARTTHLIREEIKNSKLSQAELARRYNVTRQTIRKWQDRETPLDGSHCPKTLNTTLTSEQELIVVELRRALLLATDDLLAVTREFINPDVSRAGLGRCLRRHGVSDLRDLVPVLEGEKPTAKKTFKDYEPGYLHIDIKYLPQMPDETSRRYLFVAIDRATRWVFMDIYADQSDSSSTDFLIKVKNACPIKIVKLLTETAVSLRTVLPARKKTPSLATASHPASTPSTCSAKPWRSNTGLFHRAIHKPTAWWSASMAASARSLDRPVLVPLPSSNRRCATTSKSTTIASNNAPSNTRRRSRHSKSGRVKSRNYSLNASTTMRVLTLTLSREQE
jgi:hypothetical protein